MFRTLSASCPPPILTALPGSWGTYGGCCLDPCHHLLRDDAQRDPTPKQAWVQKSGHKMDLGLQLPLGALDKDPLVPRWHEIQGFEQIGEAMKMPTGLARLWGKARRRQVIKVPRASVSHDLIPRTTLSTYEHHFCGPFYR